MQRSLRSSVIERNHALHGGVGWREEDGMARGRLTLQERRSIAAGMAAGLGFAEIGRRLGRPTSTVSREVARNGHGAYSPDAADEAARHRVRNRSAPPPTENLSEASDFVEEFAGLLGATGMPRMASRVFTSLLVSDAGSLTAADLVAQLHVSPAAVSKAIGYLEGMDLLRRDADRIGRRERYVIDDDVWLRALRTDSAAHSAVVDGAARGVEIFGAESSVGIRLGLMGRFFGGLTEHIRGMDLADPTVRDAMTVLAALVHAGRGLTTEELAGALDWPAARTADALAELEGRPTLADPFVVRAVGVRNTVGVRPDRLSPGQAAALREPEARPGPARG